MFIKQTSWILLLTLTSCCTVGTAPNNSTCSNNCQICNNIACTDCCIQFYFHASSNLCKKCTDNNCNYCVQSAPKDQCISCTNNYGISTNNRTNCLQCNKSSAFSCITVNNCGISCAQCNKFLTSRANTCIQCWQVFRQCLTCSQTSCNSCNSNFYINTSNCTSFFNSDLQCVPCDIPNCSGCTHGPRCYYCIAGYYLLNGLCQKCRLPCLTCNSTFCFSCETTTQLYLSINGSCMMCGVIGSLSNCKLCLEAPVNNYTCYRCLDLYYKNGNSCTLCDSPCLTCINSSACLSCINNGLYLYNTTSQSCDLCNSVIPNCLICFNNKICLNCSSSFSLFFYKTQCQPCTVMFSNCQTCNQTHCFSCYSNSTFDNYSCILNNCTSSCLTCSNISTDCQSCFRGYYLTSSNCINCPVQCIMCLNSTQCTRCKANYSNNNGTCQLCAVQQYYHSLNQTCYNCPRGCQICQLAQKCIICQDFYQLIINNQHSQCRQICGDGIAIQLSCDLPKGINDGCSDSCNIQPNFVCSNLSSTATLKNGTNISVNTSTCSYFGTFKVQIVEARQSLFQNTMALSFSIQPYLSGMPTDATGMLSLFELNPFCVGCSIEVLQTGIVRFVFDHNADISLANFNFKINFVLLSSNVIFQNQTNSIYPFSISQLNSFQVLGVLTTQQDHFYVKIIYYWSMLASLISILLMIIGSLSKQLAGLQHCILMQTIAMLLTFNTDPLFISYRALSGFMFSFGIQMKSNMNDNIHSKSYALDLNSSSFIYNFMFNLIAYVIPILLSLTFLILRLFFHKIQKRKQTLTHLSQLFLGQTLLYYSLFNLYGLITFSYLFMTNSFHKQTYEQYLTIFTASLITLVSMLTIIFRPSIVGIFISCFRNFNMEKDVEQENVIVSKLISFISYRPCAQSFFQYYAFFSINYYKLYISYLFISALLIINNLNFLLMGLQLIMLLFLIICKPYFNSTQKFRSIITFILLIYCNYGMVPSSSFVQPFVLLSLITLHGLLIGVIIFKSFIDLMRRRCSNRQKIAKRLFKQFHDLQKIKREQQEIKVKNQLLIRYTQVKDKQVQAELQNAKNFQQYQKKMQQLIINEEHYHLRFTKGLQFFKKYDKPIDNILIKQHYDGI